MKRMTADITWRIILPSSSRCFSFGCIVRSVQRFWKKLALHPKSRFGMRRLHGHRLPNALSRRSHASGCDPFGAGRLECRIVFQQAKTTDQIITRWSRAVSAPVFQNAACSGYRPCVDVAGQPPRPVLFYRGAESAPEPGLQGITTR